MQRHTCEAIATDLALACMDSGSDPEVDTGETAADSGGACDGSHWPQEREEETIAGTTKLAPAEFAEMTADQLIVAIEDATPLLISDLGESLR